MLVIFPKVIPWDFMPLTYCSLIQNWIQYSVLFKSLLPLVFEAELNTVISQGIWWIQISFVKLYIPRKELEFSGGDWLFISSLWNIAKNYLICRLTTWRFHMEIDVSSAISNSRQQPGNWQNFWWSTYIDDSNCLGITCICCNITATCCLCLRKSHVYIFPLIWVVCPGLICTSKLITIVDNLKIGNKLQYKYNFEFSKCKNGHIL